MDFEAFRKKQDEKKKLVAAQEKAEKDANLDWVDGLGPQGPKNPKIKGFVLGRYRKRRIDPKALKKPEGYECQALLGSVASITRRVRCCNTAEDVDVAVVQCYGCKTYYHPQCLMEESGGVCCEGKPVFLMPKPSPRSAEEIAEEKKKAGIEKPKGIQRY